MLNKHLFFLFVIFLSLNLLYAQKSEELDLTDFISEEELSQDNPTTNNKAESSQKTQQPEVKEETSTKVKEETSTKVKEETSTKVKEEASEEKKTKNNENEIPNFETKSEKRSGSNTVRIMEGPNIGTQYILLSGSLSVGYIYRDKLFSDANLGKNSPHLDSDFFDPEIYLKAQVQLQNNIKAFFELHNETRSDLFHQTSLGSLYTSNRMAENEFDLHIEKAYIEIQDFLWENLKLRTGIIPLKYSLRADGQSFFINFAESESPFSTRPDTHSIGIMGRYQPDPRVELYIDSFYFVTSETSFSRKDETIAGINIDFDFSKEFHGEDGSTTNLARFVNLIFTTIQPDNRSPIWSVGIGFDYFWQAEPIIESYGEALFQFGKYNKQDHLAFGGYIGTKIGWEKSDWKPFIDVSIWYLSGDDNNSKRKKNNDIVTYEDIDSTLILEENDYGLDIDSNYWAIKFKTGVNLKPITKEEMRLEVLYGHFGVIDAPSHYSKYLGDEIDIQLIWEYSSDLVFKLSGGYLFNSRYLKSFFNEAGRHGKKNTFMIRLETMLRF